MDMEDIMDMEGMVMVIMVTDMVEVTWATVTMTTIIMDTIMTTIITITITRDPLQLKKTTPSFLNLEATPGGQLHHFSGC